MSHSPNSSPQMAKKRIIKNGSRLNSPKPVVYSGTPSTARNGHRGSLNDGMQNPFDRKKSA